MNEFYPNTDLFFKASGDGMEFLDNNLPTPHYFKRHNQDAYTIGWLIDGYFGTKSSKEYLNDIIARIALTVPIQNRLDFAPKFPITTKAIKLSTFQNAQSLKTNYIKQAIKHHNELSDDKVWWSIKYQAESFIRQFNGWFDVDLLMQWAFNIFDIGKDVKDRSTLKAKVKNTYIWYEARGFTIPKHERGFIMSRKEAGINAAAKNAAAKKAKVQKAIAGLQFMQEKVNIANVARDAQVSRNTAKKYLIELGLK